MALEEKKISKPKVQNLIMENRERLSISGVLDVVSFNMESVEIDTELGILMIKGNDLKMSKLNLENGELIVEGNIISCIYSDNDERGRGLGFLGKLFR